METRTPREVGQAAREAGEQLEGAAGEMMEKGRELGARFSTALQNAKTNIQEKTVAGAKATDRTIRGHPYESIGIAFGVGVLIGVLCARR
jgi:ElaB/YqjD/DUF883 family membrane-anchored ribosome-binding protein